MDLNVNLRDGHGECPLGLALWTDQFDVASRLLEIGADIECMSSDEPGLLYLAIVREKSRACTFLLNNGANFKKRCGIVCCVCGVHLTWGWIRIAKLDLCYCWLVVYV